MNDLRGFIALCNRGYLGVITGMDLQHKIYYGYSIEPGNPGQPWESKDPHIIESISGLHAKAGNSGKAFTKKGVEL